MATVRRVATYLLRVLKYLLIAAWPTWVSVAIIAVPLLIAWWRFGAEEPAFRLVGMVLQIAGFSLAMWDLLSLGRLLQLPGLRSAVLGFFKNFPRYSTTHTLKANGVSSTTFVSTATLRHVRNPNADLATRVERLEADVDAMTTSIDKLRNENDGEHHAIREEFRGQANKLKEEVDAVGRTLKEALGGGMTLQWLGLLCFVYGVALASSSVELSKWLK